MTHEAKKEKPTNDPSEYCTLCEHLKKIPYKESAPDGHKTCSCECHE